MNSIQRGMVVLAKILDDRHQFDIADIMERMAMDFLPEDMRDTSAYGFDPEGPPFRGELQTKVPWGRKNKETGIREIKPRWTEDKPSPGVRPWTIGEDLADGNAASEWETYHSPSGSGNDPRGDYQQHSALDTDEIMDAVVAEIVKDLPGVDGGSNEEIISKLVHAYYSELAYDEDSFGELMESGGQIQYDPELFEKAKRDVGKYISQRFEAIESEMQGNSYW